MSPAQSTLAPPSNESWENEGGSVAPELLAATLGVTRQMTGTYSVGGFRYAKLADAIAQARRMTKLECELL
jgi:hypothetical protein